MLFVILCAIGGLGFAALLEKGIHGFDFAAFAITSLPVTIIGGIIGFVLASFIGVAVDPVYEEYKIPLVAIADTTHTNGSMFLGSGSIYEEPVYVFYRKDGNAIRQGHIPTSSTVVYEHDADSGWINVRKEVAQITWLGVRYNDYTDYAVYVPKGSVVRQFNLDLE